MRRMKDKIEGSITNADYANSAGSVAWDKVSGKPSSYPPSNHTHAYLPLGGGTMSGALNFANGTWNRVGDDAYMGDHNIAGSFCIIGANDTTRLALVNKDNQSDYALVEYGGGNLNFNKKLGANITGHADGDLPLIGGTMSGQITKSTGGSWIGDRDRAAIKSSYAGDSSYGAVAAMATKNGYWTMGNLGGDESLIFNYSTDAKYNAGKNETSQVYLPAQAGTIITSATIGSQSVNYANRAGNADVANSVDWSKVQNKPSSYAPASHTHDDRYYTESEVNTKLANYQPKGNYAAASHTHNYAGSGSAGGSANSAIKLDSSAGSAIQPVYFKDGKPVATTYTLNKTVPADAKFTDTNTWRGIQNNLTSDSTDQSLSAAQGKALKALVDGKAPTSHKHTKSQITDFPSSMPASDVYPWAKAATKPSYTKAEVGLGNVDNTADKDKSVKYATSAGSATTGLNGVSTCIFDLSSNNGSCVRFYNGLQICFGNSSKSSGVVFKLPFANDNYAVVVGGSDTLKNAWYVAGGRTTTGFNPNQSGFAVLFHWIAIGNWK